MGLGDLASEPEEWEGQVNPRSVLFVYFLPIGPGASGTSCNTISCIGIFEQKYKICKSETAFQHLSLMGDEYSYQQYCPTSISWFK